jgi:pimeloyl-ACP methyl ester carboxylesterase
LYGQKKKTRHSVFESKHDYNQPMRESMYGWMTLHLKGKGHGSPIKEPKFETEEAEVLRCFPGDSRPAGFVTLPQFAAAESKRILAKRPIPPHVEAWESEETLMRESLPKVLGVDVKKIPKEWTVEVSKQVVTATIESEAGVTIYASHYPGKDKSRSRVLLLDLDNARKAIESPLAKEFLRAGHDVITADLRATGLVANKSDKIARAPDHNSAEWSMWIGRPLLGQWVEDVRHILSLLDELNQKPADNRKTKIIIVGVGSASLVALATAALDNRIDQVGCVHGLASYVSDVPYENQRLGIIVPGILRSVGDIPQIASLVAPRRLVIAEPVSGGGKVLSETEVAKNFAWTQSIYRLKSQKKALTLLVKTDPAAIVKSFV